MAIGKILKAGVKAGVKKTGRGTRPGKVKIDAPKDLKAAKAKTGTKVTAKKVDTGAKNATSKQIDQANKKLAQKRAKASGIGVGANAASRTASKTASKTGAAASRPGRGVAASVIGGGAALTLMNKKGSSAPAKVTFADAFRKARAKGEGTKFTHDGKKYTAVTKTDLKKKGFDANELAAYNKRGGKARGPLNRLGQKAKKVLLGKDKKFGGDKGAIDFIRKPKKKADGGMMGSPQAMPAMRRRPPISMPPTPPQTPVRKAPAKRPPGGGRPTPPAASKAAPNLDPAMMAKIRSMLLAENRKLGSSNSSKPVAKKISGSSGSGESQKDQPSEVSKVKKKFKGPGMKDGGVAKKMGGGMAAKKYKGGGMATRGLGKAFKNSKR